MFYSLALNDSTDQTDTAQLAIFVRRVDRDFDTFEKLLSIQLAIFVRRVDRDFDTFEKLLSIVQVKIS